MVVVLFLSWLQLIVTGGLRSLYLGWRILLLGLLVGFGGLFTWWVWCCDLSFGVWGVGFAVGLVYCYWFGFTLVLHAAGWLVFRDFVSWGCLRVLFGCDVGCWLMLLTALLNVGVIDLLFCGF